MKYFNITAGLSILVAAIVSLTAFSNGNTIQNEVENISELAAFSMPSPPSDTLIFPEAVGWGAEAASPQYCDWNTIYVHKVTPATLFSTLENNLHPGKLDIIVFTEGGWTTNVGYEGNYDCVYIAGQTAPGGGVGMRPDFGKTRITNIRDSSHDFIWRGLTFAGVARDLDTSSPMINIRNAQRFIWAENTLLWGIEKHIAMAPSQSYETVSDVTLMRNLFAQANKIEATSMQISTGDNGGTISRVSATRNLWHSNTHRNPNWTTGSLADPDLFSRLGQSIGNVHYNTRQSNIMLGGWALDVMDNYVKPGPMSICCSPSEDYTWTVGVNVTTGSDNGYEYGNLYVDRLIGTHNRDVNATANELWTNGGSKQEVACYYRYCEANGGGDPRDSLPSTIKRDTALVGPAIPLPRIDPFILRDSLFGTASDSGQVGAYRRIQCDGTWAFRADSMLSALLKEARDSTGISTQPDSTYIIQRQDYTKAAGIACSDSDGDGMPNAFEVRIQGGVDYTGASIYGDPDNDGIPNILEYVNGTNPVTESPPVATDTIPTFPTARGHGAITFSNLSTSDCRSRDLNLQWVTNTNATGTGTLDSALTHIDNTKFNIIGFKTGGLISNRWASIGNTTPVSCLWIAGQSAPGDGIAIRSPYNSAVMSFRGSVHDLRLSYLNLWKLDLAGESDVLTFSECVGCMIDNNSLHYGTDETMSATPVTAADSILDMTWQSNIQAHTFKVGSMIQRTEGDGPIDRLTLYRNYSADLRQRRPDFNSGDPTFAYTIRMEKIEDVDHNQWSNRFGNMYGSIQGDYINTMQSQREGGSYARVWNLWPCNDPARSSCTPAESTFFANMLYTDGSTTRRGEKTDKNMWTNGTNGSALADSIWRVGRIAATGWPARWDAYDSGVTMDSARAEAIISIAGNYRGVDCYGDWYARRNGLDATAAALFTTASGRSTEATTHTDYYSTNNGFPELATGTSCQFGTNSLPDLFEIRYFGVKDTVTATADHDGDGWWVIEEWLNGTDPTVKDVIGAEDPPPPVPPTLPPGEVAYDSLNLFPGALGWGAKAWSCQDALRDGTGTVKVWKVTTTNSTGAGSLQSALDSAKVHANDNTCNYILFLKGGNYSIDVSLRYDFLKNVRISGQTARGGGVTITKGGIEFRRSFNIMAEYVRKRAPGDAQFPFRPNCTEGYYVQHYSGSWYDQAGGQNLIAIACGTESVPLDGYTQRNSTAADNLLGEPLNLHPTVLHVAGLNNTRMRRATITRNFGQGPGHRTPLVSRGDTLGIYHNIWYNTTDRAGQIESDAIRSDWFHNRYKVGPSWQDNNEKRWPLLAVGDYPGNYFNLGALAWTQNGYNDLIPRDSLIYGTYPGKKSVACDADMADWCIYHGDPPPAGMVVDDTLPTAYIADAEIDLSARLDTAMIANILATAGNYRGLMCDGTWSLEIDGIARRDSVDDRFVSQYQNGTGASTWITAEQRTYGTTPDGTQCTDSDNDGLPDEYELLQVGSTTGLDADSMTLGRPAIEWFLAGRNITGQLVGTGDVTEPEPEIISTYGDGRFVFKVGTVQSQNEAGQDRILPDLSAASKSTVLYEALIKSSEDSALVITKDTFNLFPLDSATAASIGDIWEVGDPSTKILE